MKLDHPRLVESLRKAYSAEKAAAETASVFAALRRDKSPVPLQPAAQVTPSFVQLLTSRFARR